MAGTCIAGSMLGFFLGGKRMRVLHTIVAVLAIGTWSAAAGARPVDPPDSFNSYIFNAVMQLEGAYPSRGYDKHYAYTHDIPYPENGQLVRASHAPLTMCVAATAEVIITAINKWSDEHGHDLTPYKFLPAEGWNRMRPKDIRSHIWVDRHLDSYGTADALVTFGIGKRAKFSELTPGSFVNLNRLNKSGHSVIFLGFLDKDGGILDTYSDAVAGFKYFSSQGRGTKGDAGFAFRYAFFAKDTHHPFCPKLPTGMHRDCGIIWSNSQKYLNTGYMLKPNLWNIDIRDKNLKDIADGLYRQTRSRGEAVIGLPATLSRNQFDREIETRDTMTLNPVFDNANVTTDD